MTNDLLEHHFESPSFMIHVPGQGRAREVRAPEAGFMAGYDSDGVLGIALGDNRLGGVSLKLSAKDYDAIIAMLTAVRADHKSNHKSNHKEAA